MTDLKPIEGIVARLRRKTDGSAPTVATQTISGTVTRAGQPVKTGWVGLWALRRPQNAPNAPVLQGRTVVGPPGTLARAAIHDGTYTLQVPYQSDAWYVVADEPGQVITQVGPIAVALNQAQTVAIACTAGGQIRGRVAGVPTGWEGHVWVVAFTRTGIRREARVAPDGEFALPLLPPGEYGLKVGHDAYDDAEVYPGPLARLRPESFQENADPWKRARIVAVHSGQDLSGVEVQWPD